MTAAAYPDRFDLTRILGRAATIIQHNLLILIALTLVLYGLPRLGASLLHRATDAMPWFPGAIFNATSFVYACAAVLGYCALQPAVYRVAAAELNGRQTGIVPSLRTGVSFLLPILGLFFVACIAILVGTICLIIPGIFLAVIWAAAAPAMVVERLDIGESLRRSAALTEGFRWQVFALGVIFVVGGSILHMVISVPIHIITSFGMPDLIRDAARAVTEDIFKIIMTLVSAVATFSLYFELRSLKEGAEPEELAEMLA